MMGEEEFAALENVSRETFADFKAWYNLLKHWNIKINLVSINTISNFWLRHALDSWQLVSLLPNPITHVIDMGSGAGFPGLALAIAAKNGISKNLSSVTLIESNGKKCNFLRTVIRELVLPAKVVQTRVEDTARNATVPVGRRNAVTARAFAPLPELLHYSRALGIMDISQNGQKTATFMLFPKGESWQDEVERAREQFDFDLKAIESRTNPAARILQITNARPKQETRNVML